ncbi:XRE family transcriptional regulator [Streptomyces sp. NPDC090085]|uniref:XRE family transcriptional regulator n=1 Tax=Streptomyces sp. NPDC090085 TaxID=3365943 RepID=UPI00380767E3
MRNEKLQQAMDKRGLAQQELADLVNDEIANLTGKPGTVSDRVVRSWLTGTFRWPQERQRRAIEAVFGQTAEELGFAPRGRRTPTTPAPSGDPTMQRRAMLAVTAATAVTAVAPSRRRPAVGTSDVARAKAELDRVLIRNRELGGTVNLETEASACATRCLTLINEYSPASRIRGALYVVATDALVAAAWASIDGRRLDSAGRFLDRATTTAGLSGDPATQVGVWSSVSVFASHCNRPADALAAAQAMHVPARRDPLYASLAHIRNAIGHSLTGDTTPALRAIDNAARAMERSKPDDRPEWVSFYGPAELDGLSGVTLLRLGLPARAEAHAHRALARLNPAWYRNRALYTADLAMAQIRQGDVELGATTAAKAEELAAQAPGSHRVRAQLTDVRNELQAAAPGSRVLRDYTAQTHYYRQEKTSA